MPQRSSAVLSFRRKHGKHWPVNRRAFITLIGAAAAARPLAARAQQTDRIRRIGVMIKLPENDPAGQERLAAFRDGLEKLGWTIGKNLQIDYHWGTFNDERARAAATELLNSAPDVIFANSTVALRAAQQATKTVPIVFTTVIDPVGQGFVASLAHPGGNTTGFSYLEPSVGGKWLDVLHEIAPRVTHVGFMFDPQRGPYGAAMSSFAQDAAHQLGMRYTTAPVHEAADIESAISSLARELGGGLIVCPDAFTVTHFKTINDLAIRNGLPSIYAERNFSTEGALVSYGAYYVEHFRQAAIYVDRILRGTKASDLPVQQPTKFDFVVNFRTAKLLELTVPTSVQLLADEVIE